MTEGLLFSTTTDANGVTSFTVKAPAEVFQQTFAPRVLEDVKDQLVDVLVDTWLDRHGEALLDAFPPERVSAMLSLAFSEHLRKKLFP